MGLNTCALCHSGGVIAPGQFHFWQTTAHSMIFSNGIGGCLGSYSASCLKCHTVGYDVTPSAASITDFTVSCTQTGWVFPTVLSPTNWAAMQAAYPMRTLGNIQCENCHGPGSQHVFTSAAGSAIPISLPRRLIPAIATNATTPRRTTSMAPNGMRPDTLRPPAPAVSIACPVTRPTASLPGRLRTPMGVMRSLRSPM